MENASKALIMAGSVLIGIIVISLFMIMYNSLTDYQQTQTQNQREAQIVTFNNQFEGYIRDDVKGYELMSLVNKVVDYNKRQSTKGTQKDEQGQDYGYKPITLIINFANVKNMFSRSGNNELIKKNEYTFDNTITRLEDELNFSKIEELKGQELPKSDDATGTFKYTGDSLEGLLNTYDLIFNYTNADEFNKLSIEEKRNVFDTFNNIIGPNDKNEVFFKWRKISGSTVQYLTDNQLRSKWSQYLAENGIKNTTTKTNIWQDVNKYYEYDQFKRAIFECKGSDVKYDEGTGRIIQLKFTFTKKFS